MPDTRGQIRRAYYGQRVASDLISTLAVPSGASFLNTATAGVATGNYATAVGVLVNNFCDMQGRLTSPYIVEKHFFGNRRVTSFWYFGKCVDPLGRTIPGTERLSPYPFRIYSESTHYYGTLPLGVQGVQGKLVVTSARMDFRKSSATAGSNGVAAGLQGVKADNTNSATGEAIVATAAGLKFSLSQGVIATNAVQTAVEAASVGTGTGSITDGVLSNLIAFSAVGTMSSSAQNFAASNYVNSSITDSSGGTKSTTFAALTATVTSTVVANALAQLAYNENKRLGLFGALMDGSSAVQGLFLNLGSTTSGDGAAGGSNVIEGELLLNGVVEVSYELVGDV